MRSIVAVCVIVLGVSLSYPAGGQAESGITLDITVDGNGSTLQWNPFPDAGGYRVEFTESLFPADWQTLPFPIEWSDGVRGARDDAEPSDISQRFYRVAVVPLSDLERGDVIALGPIESLTAEELAGRFQEIEIPIPVENGIDVCSVVYRTIDPFGEPAVASGALVIPSGINVPLPLAGYQHATVLKKDDVPSRGVGIDYLAGEALGGLGFVAAMPDYLGLGVSEGRHRFHPFVHAGSEASAVIDMLRAARTICAQRNVALNQQLFLMGYSQGGHATMAAHRELQLHHGEEFTVTASAPMAGPYSLSEVMLDTFTADEPYAWPALLPYTLLAYNEIYPLFESPSDVMVEPYASEMAGLFDGTHSADDINAVLPAVPRQMLRPDYLQQLESDPDHPLRVALRENDVFDWKPEAPVRLFHCTEDEVVPFENSEIAFQQFSENGATNIELKDPRLFPSSPGTHEECAPWAVLTALDWFKQLKE